MKVDMDTKECFKIILLFLYKVIR